MAFSRAGIPSHRDGTLFISFSKQLNDGGNNQRLDGGNFRYLVLSYLRLEGIISDLD